jgi:hypothetical protein
MIWDLINSNRALVADENIEFKFLLLRPDYSIPIADQTLFIKVKKNNIPVISSF